MPPPHLHPSFLLSPSPPFHYLLFICSCVGSESCERVSHININPSQLLPPPLFGACFNMTTSNQPTYHLPPLHHPQLPLHPSLPLPPCHRGCQQYNSATYGDNFNLVNSSQFRSTLVNSRQTLVNASQLSRQFLS